MNTLIIITFIRLLLILPFYLSNIFACNCSYEKNVIVKSNREYDYFGNVLEYEYDYFPSYSSTSTQKVLVLEYDYSISAAYTTIVRPLLEYSSSEWDPHTQILINQIARFFLNDYTSREAGCLSEMLKQLHLHQRITR